MEIIIVALLFFIEHIELIIEYAVIIVPIVIVVFLWYKIGNPMIQEYKRKQKLQFNEYDNIDQIKQYTEENEQLENEVEKTKKQQIIKFRNLFFGSIYVMLYM